VRRGNGAIPLISVLVDSGHRGIGAPCTVTRQGGYLASPQIYVTP